MSPPSWMKQGVWLADLLIPQFRHSSFLQSKYVNNVCKLLQLLSAFVLPGSLTWGKTLEPARDFRPSTWATPPPNWKFLVSPLFASFLKLRNVICIGIKCLSFENRINLARSIQSHKRLQTSLFLNPPFLFSFIPFYPFISFLPSLVRSVIYDYKVCDRPSPPTAALPDSGYVHLITPKHL